MSRGVEIVSEDFLRGLLDTQDEVGLDAGWAKFTNLRVARKNGENRKGMVGLVQPGDSDQAAATFDGSTDYYEIPLRTLHTLPLNFTFESVFKPTTVTGTDYLWGVKHANYGFKVRRNATTLEILIHDGSNSATIDAGTVAADSTYALRVTYDGTTASAWLQDSDHGATVVEESGTVSGQLRTPGGSILLGADEASPTNLWQGSVEYIRAFSKIMPDGMRHLWQLWPHPKGPYVLWDYVPVFVDGNSNLVDHSVHLNSGAKNGTPGSETTLLPPCDPVQVLAQRVDNSNQSKIVVVAGGVPYEEAL